MRVKGLIKVKVIAYAMLVLLLRKLASTMHFNSKTMLTTDNDYSWHIKAVEFVNQS